ncbi:diaminopimelate decarboxylase [Candidatus Pacearchaeota archaeon]|nr:diaminopimelate decarboxylase [Candidatus Pacearchaeota archaeon]
MASKTKPEPLSPVVSPDEVREIANRFGTPVYVYSQRILEQQADSALAFPNAYGLTVRYAMKANPNMNIARLFRKRGILLDVSSGFEAERARMKAEIPYEDMLMTSQEIPENLFGLVEFGLDYNACSQHQLENFGIFFPGKEVSVRINPGAGSGGTNRTNTGGESASFGIWHEQLDDVFRLARKYELNVKRVHTHIGSGSDPAVWQRVAGMSLDIVARFLEQGHDVRTLNLGGGYKVARMSYEKATDLQECGKPVKEAFKEFARDKGVKLGLEIEPGTFLVANAGCIIAKVIDLKRTAKYKFLITDTGMPEVTRPSLYGAQHPIAVVHRSPSDGEREPERVIVSGHCCESGDILTPAPGDSEKLKPRWVEGMSRGDFVVIGGTGAYCAGMSTINYNSYPQSPEVLITGRGIELIRKRQTLEQMTRNELVI